MKKEFVSFHLINSVAQGVKEVMRDGKYADRVIEKYHKANRDWTAKDRQFVAESIYEIVRGYRRFEFIAESDEVFDVVGAYLILTRGELPKGRIEFSNVNADSVKARSILSMSPEIQDSFPDWMNELGNSEFGADWPKLMKALNEPPEIYLRVNTLKATVEQVKKSLADEGIETKPIVSKKFNFPVGLKLPVRKNVFATQAFKNGFFEMQDAASQLVADFVAPEPGMNVVDACAGAGGKSLHLAALMKNQGKLISMDIHEWKLKDLQQRATRAGVKVIETQLIGNKTIQKLENQFDRVLLDVPCSGMGVLRRNPDAKWNLKLAEIEGLQKLQRQLLTGYSAMAGAGAVMVYSTCSILHRENEDQVKWFLNSDQGKSWTLEKELRVWPHQDGFDGFYGARLKKKT